MRMIPCEGCGMIAHDEGITYEDLETAGAIIDGKMVRHFTDCPFSPHAYPRITGKQGLAALEKALADIAAAIKEIWPF